jgi:hypothetical protein
MKMSDLDFCRRKVVHYARQAVHSKDRSVRRALAMRASAWFELSQAVEASGVSIEDFRISAELPKRTTPKSNFTSQT